MREKNENTKITVFYIDIRTIGRLEKYYFDMLEEDNLSFVKGKVAKIIEDPVSKNLTLDVEDTVNRENMHAEFDMVVLATGIVPNTDDINLPVEMKYDEYGFIDGSTEVEGIYAAGCVTHPCDVARTTKESTAAVLKAIQCLYGGE